MKKGREGGGGKDSQIKVEKGGRALLQANPDLWNGTTDILWLSYLSGLIISVQFYLLLLL